MVGSVFPDCEHVAEVVDRYQIVVGVLKHYGKVTVCPYPREMFTVGR